MNPELLVPIGVAVVAILAAIAAFTIAWRRSSSGTAFTVTRETRAADRSGRVDVSAATAATTIVEDDAVAVPEVEAVETVEEAAPVGAAVSALEAVEVVEAVEEAEPVGAAVSVATAQRLIEVSPEEAGVTRRSFLNRALGATFLGGFLGGQALAFLSFLWPKVTGGFGSDVIAGKATDLLAQAINADGSVTPVFIPEARAYIVPAPAAISAQFEGRAVDGGGVMALYQRCVHLGCRVPWCQPSQGFECPCHGSKYNGVGEYFAGPAPRNLDRFVVEVSDAGDLIVKTGTIIETPRAIDKSVEYPKGPSCIGG